MNNRVNYTFVGLLVLVGIGLMMAFTYWMLKPASNEEIKNYTIYFNESVLGLNIDAPVKYRGIRVGKVAELKINSKNSEQVQVRVEILKTTPIKVSTVAKLTAQGITGLTYINLSHGNQLEADLQATKGEKYPVIKTTPSFFENFEKSLGSVSSRLTSTLGKTEELLGADNQEQMALLLRRSANVMEKMDKLLDEKTINHLQSSAKHLDSFSAKLDKVMPNIDTFVDSSLAWEDKISSSFQSMQDSFGSIKNSYKGIQGSMGEFQRAVGNGEFNIKEITSDIVPTMNTTLMQMQELMIKFEETLNQYEKSPSDILYKTQKIQKAPGEK